MNINGLQGFCIISVFAFIKFIEAVGHFTLIVLLEQVDGFLFEPDKMVVTLFY
jgi:hypothetical protein